MTMIAPTASLETVTIVRPLKVSKLSPMNVEGAMWLVAVVVTVHDVSKPCLSTYQRHCARMSISMPVCVSVQWSGNRQPFVTLVSNKHSVLIGTRICKLNFGGEELTS